MHEDAHQLIDRAGGVPGKYSCKIHVLSLIASSGLRF